MHQDLQNILFLDIETVSMVEDYSSLDERLKVQWARKAEFIRRESEQTDEELFQQRAGIYAEFGKIVCIGVGMLECKEEGIYTLQVSHFSSQEEITVLKRLKQLLDTRNGKIKRLCAHNGKEFDFPYICRRMLINGMTLPTILDIREKKPWEVSHLDTMVLWKFGDYKNYTSLELLTILFDIPSSKNAMDGSQVNEVYYQKNDLDGISAYCEEDVVAVAQLYLKMHNLPLVLEKNIKRTQ